MSPPEPPTSAPGNRDVERTAFSHQLDALLDRLPEAISIAFVDSEGETVDLSSREDPFEARIAGAEMAIVLASMRRCVGALQCGEALELRVEGDDRSLLARHVSEGYDLVVLLKGPVISRRSSEAVAETALALLAETGFDCPRAYFEPRAVEAHVAVDGSPTPRALELAGVRRTVEAVIGRMRTADGFEFLVRLDNGQELLLRYATVRRAWTRAPT